MMTHHRREGHRVEVILQQRTVIYFHPSLNWLKNYHFRDFVLDVERKIV